MEFVAKTKRDAKAAGKPEDQAVERRGRRLSKEQDEPSRERTRSPPLRRQKGKARKNATPKPQGIGG